MNSRDGDIYISKGDYFKEINELFQARYCYQQTLEEDKLKKSSHDNETTVTHRVYTGKEIYLKWKFKNV